MAGTPTPSAPGATAIPASIPSPYHSSGRSEANRRRRPQLTLAVYAGLVSLVFLPVLAKVWSLALSTELHSYIPAVPFISGYLLYIRPKTEVPYRRALGVALLLVAAGLAAVAVATGLGDRLGVTDSLALMMLAYVLLIVAGGFIFLGSAWLSTAVFPTAFLVFMVPLPDVAVYWIERASVNASADVAAWLFRLTGTPLYRDGTFLTLPGIVLAVAQECSGIRSSLVLFITGLLASYLLLQSPWRRILLVAFVIPLGIVRNGFRILVIGLLCVRYGPQMIDSFVHRRGGPIFFVLSLIPLLALLWLLRGRDSRGDVRT